ncbi:hypothetical protein Ssi03_27120 [Sphaerisporangium siamense]|nr:hypothetical protein Ssi03_27120 [Sphaerisporangium siamense]
MAFELEWSPGESSPDFLAPTSGILPVLLVLPVAAVKSVTSSITHEILAEEID